MELSATSASNVLQLIAGVSTGSFRLRITHTGDINLKPCLTDMYCVSCVDQLFCAETALNMDLLVTQEQKRFGVTYVYRCPPGGLFSGTDPYFNNTCNWDDTWSLTFLPPCIGEL